MDNSKKLTLFRTVASRSVGLRDITLSSVKSCSSCKTGCSNCNKSNPSNNSNALNEWVPFSCAYNDGSGGFAGYIQDSDVAILSSWSGVSCSVLYT